MLVLAVQSLRENGEREVHHYLDRVHGIIETPKPMSDIPTVMASSDQIKRIPMAQACTDSQGQGMPNGGTGICPYS